MAKLRFEDFDKQHYPLVGHALPHLRYKGVWDMQDLYEFMIHYMRDRKYKFYERVYKHKHPSPFGVERQYIWHAERALDEVWNLYFDIYIHTYDAHDIEIKTKDGRMRTFTNGRLWMEFNSGVRKMLDERWENNRFFASLRMFLNNYIFKKAHGELYWDWMMYRETQRLIWLVRRRLKMEYDDYEQKDWMGVHT